MAESSINFQQSQSGGLEHIDRTEGVEPDYLLPKQFRLDNEIDRSAKMANLYIKQLLSKAAITYQKKFKQKLQAKSYLWEGVVNLNQEHTIFDLQRLVKRLEKETGFTCVQIGSHKDEGHIEKDKEGKKFAIHNFHAHLTFFTLDANTGQQLYRKDISKPKRRKLKQEVEAKYKLKPEAKKSKEDFIKKYKWTKNSQLMNKRIRELIRQRNMIIYNKERMSYLQTIVANELGMVRGTVSVKREAERLGVEVSKATPRLEHKGYRQAKNMEESVFKRVKELELENKKLKEKLNTQGILLNEKDSSIEAMKEEIRLAEKRIQKLKIDQDQYYYDIDELSEYAYCDNLDPITGQLAKVLWKDKYEKLEQENSNLQIRVSSLSKKIEEYKIQVTQFQAMIKNLLASKINNLVNLQPSVNPKDEVAQRLEIVQNRIQRIEEKMKKLSIVPMDLQNEYYELRTEESRLKNKLKKDENAISNLNSPRM